MDTVINDSVAEHNEYKDLAVRFEQVADLCTRRSRDDRISQQLLCQLDHCSGLLSSLQAQEKDPLLMHAFEQLSATVEEQKRMLTFQIMKQPRVIDPYPTESSNNDMGNQSRSRRLTIEDTIMKKGQVKFCDVAGLCDAKQALKEAIIMPVQFPQLFTGNRKPWRRILLYGPPGTGKSHLAQAVASEISSTFYCVSSADLVSSWVGESEKLIKELFYHATAQEGRSVVFIDEIDSICRRRSSREEEYTRRIKTELLKQMEGADNSCQAERVFVLCATNCPWELDPAFLRRFQKRIYIPLPDRAARKELLQLHAGDLRDKLTVAEWTELAELTHGYSGSDLANITLEALFEPIRDMQQASHWTITSEGKYTPCSSKINRCLQIKMDDLPPEQVQPRDVQMDDFLSSLKVHRNTVSPEELQKFENFTKSYGQNG